MRSAIFIDADYLYGGGGAPPWSDQISSGSMAI